MKLRAILALFACLATATATLAETDWAPGTRVPGRVVITLREGLLPTVAKSGTGIRVDVPALQALADRYQVTGMEQPYAFAGAPKQAGEPDLRLTWAVDFPPDTDLDTVLRAYAALPEVAKAEAVDVCVQYALPNDPSLGSQWHLRNLVFGGKDIRAPGGWAEALGDTNVIIAIVDSGVDWRHPDLGGSGPNYRRGAIWTNWDEVNGTTGVDDDANGRIDDYRGWDFVTGVTGAAGQDVNLPDNDPSDFESHGTACAGVASAITNNGVGVAGAAWGCKVMPVRVGWLPAGAEVGVVRMDFAASGMIYAAQNGAKIINCSWGSTEFLATAVNYCLSQGAIIVCAAGNADDETASYLAEHPDVIAVAATTQNDGKASFSSYGTWVELSAPGVDMYTTWYTAATTSHGYAVVQGTSFSSPLTCGALGLLWSAHPGWTRSQVIARLLDTADDIDPVNPGYGGKLGAGRINLLRALGDRIQEVPEEFSSLFDAMNEAAVGDTIAFRSTTVLTGPLTVENKEVSLLGGWNAALTARDPAGAPTVITGNATSAGLRFAGGVGPGTVVDGFRVTGGGGQTFSSPQSGRYGGGVICNSTSPTLRNLDITGNTAGGSAQFGGGGGLLLLNSNSVVEDCTIHGNSAVHGGGVYIYLGAPTLRRCTISGNALVQDNGGYAPRGGGLYVTDASPLLRDCVIAGHVDAESGGGLYAANTLLTTALDLAGNTFHGNTARLKGGALCASGATLAMKRDLLHDNGQAAGSSFMLGGGVAVENATATLDSVTARGNNADVGGGVSVSGGASAVVRNSVLTGNAADLFGGGLAFQAVAAGEIAGNTLAGNSGGLGAGGLYIASTGPAVTRNIVAFNTGGPTFVNGVQVNGGAPTFSCNDAWSNGVGNYGGVADPTGTAGNVALDPQFCNAGAGNYGIGSGSPCAPAHSGGCGLIGALAAGCGGTPVEDGDPELPALVFRVEPAAPNPFNPTTRIRFTLPAAGRAQVRVYDAAGRLVRTLVDAELAAAAHVATWDGRDDAGRSCPSGVYFYRVAAGQLGHVGRVALVK